MFRTPPQRRQAILHRQRVECRNGCAVGALPACVFQILFILAAALSGGRNGSVVLCHARNIVQQARLMLGQFPLRQTLNGTFICAGNPLYAQVRDNQQLYICLQFIRSHAP